MSGKAATCRRTPQNEALMVFLPIASLRFPRTGSTLHIVRHVKAPTAKDRFKQRVRYWTERIDVHPSWLAVRPMTRKWASCSTDGHLHFNADLLDLAEAGMD